MLYWEWHLIPNWPLRSIFAWVLEQLLKDLVSWGSPGECSMVDHFLRDASVFWPARFGVLFCSVVLGCSQWCPVPNCGCVKVWHAHRRSVVVLCKLYKIRCNPMYQLNDALPGPYGQVRVTRGTLVAHQYTYAPPRCRKSQYRRTFVSLSVSLWNDLADPVFDGVGLSGFKSRINAFL